MTTVRTTHTIECEDTSCHAYGQAILDENGDVVEVHGPFFIPDREAGCAVMCNNCGCEVDVPEEADEEDDDYDAATVHNGVTDLVQAHVNATVLPFSSDEEDDVVVKAIAAKVLGSLVNDPYALRAIRLCMEMARRP